MLLYVSAMRIAGTSGFADEGGEDEGEVVVAVALESSPGYPRVISCRMLALVTPYYTHFR